MYSSLFNNNLRNIMSEYCRETIYQNLISSNEESEDSISSIGSTSSTDMSDDASSSLSSSSFSLSSLSSSLPQGPDLYELSELMNQLPIKKGLSKYYQGKSESFTSLSNVRCIQDLAKRNTAPFKRELLNCHIPGPKPKILKMTARSSARSSTFSQK